MVLTKLRNLNRLGALITLTATLFILSGSITPAQAAYSWMSQVKFYDAETDEQISYDQYHARDSSSTAVFDVSISLHNNPQGDDDWTQDSTSPDDTDQRKYEAIIKYWADAIYESTNGAHKLGTVRIFRNGKQSKIADVVWNASEWPRANISGYGVDGKRIMFGDVFPGGCGTGCDKDMLADDDGAGYTLGHEWGHYTYGLYDEYQGSSTGGSITSPRSTDTPVSPAIMNSQWNARGGNYEWLNFSTSNNIGDVNKTAQGRAYGASCWDTLIREAKNDPKDGDRKALPKRTYYSALNGVQPTATDNWVKKQLPTDQTAARDKLNIIWMGEDIVLQIVIDRSGSMSGSPIANAQQAANALVDVTQNGKTALGVVSFNDTVTQDQAITAIPDPGGDAVKTTIKGVINGLTATGLTALYDGATTALTNLDAWYTANNSKANKVVFVLSDGGDNSSTATETSVISAYKTSSVPLFTFGFGSGAPGGTLSKMADQTGGKFYSSPTTLAEIQAAFLDATAAVSSVTSLTSSSASTAAGGNSTYTYIVDATIDALAVATSYTGSLGDVTFALNGPNGALAETLTCTAAGTSVSCTCEVPNATLQTQGTGTYNVTATNTTGAAVDVAVNVVGYPVAGSRTFAVTVGTIGGSEVNYPEPAILTATVSQGVPITGVNLTATITESSGAKTTLTMNDAGTDGDAVAGDGVYSALWGGYSASGNFTVNVSVDNSSGTAAFSGAGFQPVHYFAANENGGEPTAPAYSPITSNFTRTGSTSFIIPTYTTPSNGSVASATVLEPAGQAPDNTDNPGRIDSAGDEDFYQIHDIVTTQDLVVRVTDLALNITPVLKIWKSDGTEYGTSANNITSWNGYVYRVIPMADLEATMYASVSDNDPAAVGGVYNISAGAAIGSDTTTTPGTTGTTSPGGGGSGGCFIESLYYR